MTITCPYCSCLAELVTGDTVYPSRKDLATKKLWICKPCKAWVGCHDGTETPLGRLANAELRWAKMEAHASFDPLWKAKIRRDKCSKKEARGAAYKWLAQKLGIPFDETHIGMFDVDMCKKVVEVCAPYINKAN